MPSVVYASENIGKLAHRAWRLISSDPGDERAPDLTYEEVMDTFRAVH
jgi:hypothetical protein